MQTRVAVMSIILNDSERAGEVNALLHAYNEYVIGRMGIPYRQKGIYIISVAVARGDHRSSTDGEGILTRKKGEHDPCTTPNP